MRKNKLQNEKNKKYINLQEKQVLNVCYTQHHGNLKKLRKVQISIWFKEQPLSIIVTIIPN